MPFFALLTLVVACDAAGETAHDDDSLLQSEIASGPSPEDVRLVAPESTVAGGLLRVLLLGVGGSTREAESLELRDQDGLVVASAEPIQGPVPFARFRYFLIGIDSTLRAGEYALVYDGAQLGEVDILRGDYRSVEIPLSTGLTSLRRDYDPRKVTESEELTRLVLSRDSLALFHTEPLEWPLPPDTRQSSLFGDRRTYLYSNGDRAQTVHVGLDLAAPTGTPIVSSGAGVVRMARSRIVTGNTVVIEHLPGLYSLYYHLDSIDVTEGHLVRTGAPIGTVGATGLATGPHLHWEVRVSGVPVSPELLTAEPLIRGLTP